MSAFIKGETLILSLWNGTDAYEPIACLTSNALSMTRNIIESQTKCDPGVIVKNPGSLSYEVSFEGQDIVNESGKFSHDGLFTLMNVAQGTSNTWKLDTGQSGTVAYYGTGVLQDLERTDPAGDELVTFSGTLSGSGLILTTDPN